jgi:hypothetical protein
MIDNDRGTHIRDGRARVDPILGPPGSVGTAVRRDQLRPGDLLFFYTPVSHVGIYLGKGKMVHASTSGQPVKISRIGGRPFHNARRI